MAPLTLPIGLLTLAGTSLAAAHYPRQGGFKHAHFHSGVPSGGNPGPYGGNGTFSGATGTGTGTGATTTHVTKTSTIYSTVTVEPEPAPVHNTGSGNNAVGPSASHDTCSASTETVTVTPTATVTVTVTATASGGASSASAVGAAGASSASSAQSAAPFTHAGHQQSHTSVVAATGASTSNCSSSVYHSPTIAASNSSSAVGAIGLSSSTTSSSASSSPSSSSGCKSNSKRSASGKRGCGFNDARACTTLQDAASGSGSIAWGFNWNTTDSGDLNCLGSTMHFVPQLWGPQHPGTSDSAAGALLADWNATAEAAISNGALALLGPNEPDNAGQLDQTPSQVADFWMYLGQYKGKIPIGSPAVTSSGSDGQGLSWLAEFHTEITKRNMAGFDFVQIHYYQDCTNGGDTDLDTYFIPYLTKASTSYNNADVWVTEIGCDLSKTPTAAQMENFMNNAVKWMEDQTFIARYAWLMAAANSTENGQGNLLNAEGSSPSYLGSSYMKAPCN